MIAGRRGPRVSAIVVENISKHWTTAEGQVRAVDGLSALDEGAGVTFKSCTGHPGCGKFPRGLPVEVGDSQSTGCPYVDAGVIFEGWQ
jgi:hypothetical protein